MAWLMWAAEVGQTYGASPGDGGAIRAVGERWAMASVLAAVGILPFAGLAFYTRRYIVRLERSRADAEVTVIGWWAPSRRRYGIAAFSGSTEHEGRVSGDVSVDAPWITLRIAGKRYVVDLQSERVDRRGLARLVSGDTQAQRSKQA